MKTAVKEKQVVNGRNNVAGFENKTGLNLSNWGVLRTEKYKAAIAKDIFRFLVEWQEKGTKDIYKDSIDYVELADEEIDITDLKAVIEYVIDRGESDDVVDNKDFEEHLTEAGENNFEIKVR